MARIRTIKPELASDKKLSGVSREARYTFILLITQADDDGLVLGNARQLLGTLYPHDDALTLEMLTKDITELAEIGAVRWRETKDGAAVVQIVNWERHQKVNHKGKSLILPQLEPVARKSPDILLSSSSNPLAPTYDLRPPTSTSDLGPDKAAAPSGSQPPCLPTTTDHAREDSSVRALPCPERAGGPQRGAFDCNCDGKMDNGTYAHHPWCNTNFIPLEAGA